MNSERGFTMPELIVVIVLTSLFSVLLFDFALGYSRYGSIMQSNSIALTERLNVSDYLRENLGVSSGLINQNSIDDANVLVPDADPDHWKFLRAVEGDFGDSSTITPLFYYRKQAKDTSGVIAKNGELFYEDEYVVYHDGPEQELRVRTLANPDVTSNAATTTCPPASASTSCPEDKLLISGITSVSLRYFSRAGIPVSYDSIDESGNVPCTDTYPYATCAGADYASVEVLEATLNLEKRPTGVGSNSTQSATIVRIALRNR